MTALFSSLDWQPAAVFVGGLFVGRFLNLCIERFPRSDGDDLFGQLRLVFDRPAACDGCGSSRPWWQFLPILSSLPGCGRCPACRRRLPARFGFVELVTAGLLTALYSLEPIPPAGGRWICFSYHAVLVCSLIVATFIDLDLKIIPDGSTLPAMAVGVLGSFLLPIAALTPIWHQDPFPGLWGEFAPGTWNGADSLRNTPLWIDDWPRLHRLAVSIVGVIVGGGIVWVVRIVGRLVLGREAMGFGDVILLAMIGSFLGWQATVMIFFLAPICALVVVVISWILLRNREIPFGPYLSLGAVIVLFGWEPIWSRTQQIFGLGAYLPVLAGVMFVAFVILLLLMRGIQKLLGFEPPADFIEEWTSADQLSYLAGELTELDTCQCRRETWPGLHSGRGTLHRRTWRNSS